MDEKAYLQRKGSIDLLFELENMPKSFNELEETLRFSPNTILSRLREAQRLGLIKEELFREKSGRARIKYKLTDKGKNLLKELKKIKNKYLELVKEISTIEKAKKKKEAELEELISSLKVGEEV